MRLERYHGLLPATLHNAYRVASVETFSGGGGFHRVDHPLHL